MLKNYFRIEKENSSVLNTMLVRDSSSFDINKDEFIHHAGRIEGSCSDS